MFQRLMTLLGRRRVELRLSVTVVVEKEEDGTYHAFCPGLKGLHVPGDTINDALQNATEAIKVYLDSLAQHGDPLPVGPNLTLEQREIPEIPEGALLHHITVGCHSPGTYGIS